LAAGCEAKIFFNFFQNSGTFLCSDVVIYMERKTFFQKPKPNIIDCEKILKPFDKIRIDKNFLLMYNDSVNTDVKS